MFRQKHNLASRKEEARRILEKYPSRIPVICERANNNIKDLDKKKYLIPEDLKMIDFLMVVRRRLKLPAHQSIFVFVNEKLINGSEMMKVIYDNEKDEDGFLYVMYGGESTFG
jgi:GABA(A) receptor-associated protein